LPRRSEIALRLKVKFQTVETMRSIFQVPLLLDAIIGTGSELALGDVASAHGNAVSTPPLVLLS
jgi:DNA-directed RNA polymerase sigma subunit (sigma70/sigma32)